MNPIRFALRHPVTILVGVVALVAASVLAGRRMKVDIFPALNMPTVYVCQPYGGMDATQMEGLLVNYYEFHFLYVSGIHHVESKSIQGMSLMKLVFHPGTDMAQAMAETVAAVNRARFMMPPGTVPPFVNRYDTGSAAVGYLVLSSETKSIKEIQDLATLKVRPQFASIPGISTPPAFGGNQRAIVVNLDPDKLRGRQMTGDDVMAALSTGNVVSPSGNVRINDRMPIVPTNSIVGMKPTEELGRIPLRLGSQTPLFLRDVLDEQKGIEDASDITSGYALVNGRRSVYMLVTKRADASTLNVIDALKESMSKLREQVPADVKIELAFDQSPIVREAIWGVASEGLIGALLTGLMVLVFLRDWRSVIVVVLNIPLAILAAVSALWLCGETINLMTLGGLALAVGILVDEATVEVENIHTQMSRHESIARAVRAGNQETAVPRLLAMLCILAVFIPAAFMEGSAKALFMPLALAVGFSMIASYILSSTFVPVLAVWLMHHHDADTPGKYPAYRAVVSKLVQARWLVVPLYGLVALGIAAIVGSQLGREIFPQTDSGQFQMRLRAPTGTRIEWTEAMAQEALRVVESEVGAGNIALSVGYIGMFPTNYPVQAIYQWTSGPEETFIKLALKPGVMSVAELKRRLREKLPNHLRNWLAEKLRGEGISEETIAVRVEGLRSSFEPSDIINEVMSFGSPTPVEVAISGVKLDDGKLVAEHREYVDKVESQLRTLPKLKDVQFVQALDYPALEVRVDREKAGISGATMADVTRSLLSATASSRYVMPNYWFDRGSGQGYIVQVQVPVAEMKSIRDMELIPVKGHPLAYLTAGETNGGMSALTAPNLLVRDVASVHERLWPAQIDRYNMKRTMSLTANAEGLDLGRIDEQVRKAVHAAGEPPKGVTVSVRGQLEPMRLIFDGLTIGLGVAVLAVFLMLTAYFQSIRLAIAATASVPAVLAGVVLLLFFTQTTINLQSFMGAIMAVGVATANAILLVTFAERERHRNGGDAIAAAIEGARSRLRPIVMTSCAMVAGMVPMALGVSAGGDTSSPLARAVIGGLIAATIATLFFLPAVFAIFQGRTSLDHPSLDPDDENSPRYDGGPRGTVITG